MLGHFIQRGVQRLAVAVNAAGGQRNFVQHHFQVQLHDGGCMVELGGLTCAREVDGTLQITFRNAVEAADGCIEWVHNAANEQVTHSRHHQQARNDAE